MLIDCDTCAAPATACQDCVMTVLFRSPPTRAAAPVDIDAVEQEAISTLARAGLVPPLRLVVAVTPGFDIEDGPPSSHSTSTGRPRSAAPGRSSRVSGGCRGIA